jgi:hypothetical protein
MLLIAANATTGAMSIQSQIAISIVLLPIGCAFTNSMSPGQEYRWRRPRGLCEVVCRVIASHTGGPGRPFSSQTEAKGRQRVCMRLLRHIEYGPKTANLGFADVC